MEQSESGSRSRSMTLPRENNNPEVLYKELVERFRLVFHIMLAKTEGILTNIRVKLRINQIQVIMRSAMDKLPVRSLPPTEPVVAPCARTQT